MCFRFGSCFGSGSGQDFGRSTPKTTHRGGGWWSQADHGYYSGADHKAAPAYHYQPAADEAGRRDDHNGGAWKDHVDDASRHGYVQDKAHETSKHPAAWSSKIGDDAGQAYTAAHLHDAAAADRREQAPADYHHYPTATTTPLARF